MACGAQGLEVWQRAVRIYMPWHYVVNLADQMAIHLREFSPSQSTPAKRVCTHAPLGSYDMGAPVACDAARPRPCHAALHPPTPLLLLVGTHVTHPCACLQPNRWCTDPWGAKERDGVKCTTCLTRARRLGDRRGLCRSLGTSTRPAWLCGREGG